MEDDISWFPMLKALCLDNGTSQEEEDSIMNRNAKELKQFMEDLPKLVPSLAAKLNA